MELYEFFREHPRCALGFSGGTDSAYLLAAGREYGAELRPYYVRTAFQPRFELDDAFRMCEKLNVGLTVLDYDILAVPRVADNPRDRCYFCKRAIFKLIREHASADGFDTIIDGNNASDDAGDRPGMRAVRELGVLSPLRLCGITKAEVRERSEALGLFTARKPAYACLATRVPAGTRIEAADLAKIERGEEALKAMGFSDLRVRIMPDGARLELPGEQMARAVEMREDILSALVGDFGRVVLDMKGR